VEQFLKMGLRPKPRGGLHPPAPPVPPVGGFGRWFLVGWLGLGFGMWFGWFWFWFLVSLAGLVYGLVCGLVGFGFWLVGVWGNQYCPLDFS
jgi:hypothetical protein